MGGAGSEGQEVMAEEKWAPIPGVPGYTVSTDGRIRNTKTGGMMGVENHNGRRGVYSRAHVTVNGKGKHIRIHRAVLLAFTGPPPDTKAHACHLNGDSSDNRLDNLCWGDQALNERHKRGITVAPAICCHCGREDGEHDESGQCVVPGVECPGWERKVKKCRQDACCPSL